MDGVVQRLRCRYLLPGGSATAGVQARLDQVARRAVERAWSTTLDATFAEDPTVYVLRRVQASHRLTPSVLLDPRLADSWGDSLAAAVTRTIAADAGDGANLVRFEDQTDYLTQFVVDLVDGVAWSRWFYGPFAPLRSRTTADALAAVLLADRARLAAVLARLHRVGALDKVLGALSEPARRSLWVPGLGGPAPVDPETARILLAAAAELAAALDLWAGRPDQPLLERYLSTGPRPVRWGDPVDLAAGTWEAFRWLVGERYPAREAVQPERLDPPLARLDWLDTGWLRERLLGLLAEPDADARDLPTRPTAGTPTPRRQELLQDLLALVRSGAVRLDPTEPASAANALRLQAALHDQAPRWVGDAAVPEVVQRLLRMWGWLQASPSPAEALRRLRGGDLAVARQAAPAFGNHAAGGSRAGAGSAGDDRSGAAPPLDADTADLVAGLGAAAVDLVDELHASATGRRREGGVDSPSAGVLLLLRALADVRLLGLAARVGYPPGAAWSGVALPVALGLRWAGAARPAGRHVDDGVALLAGLDTPPALEAVGRAWSGVTHADGERFELAWLAVLAGHGLLDGDGLHLFALPSAHGTTTVVASSDPSGPWPVGRVVAGVDELPTVAAGWMAAWQALTGQRPGWVRCDQALTGPLRAGLPDDQVTGVTVGDGPPADEGMAAHRLGRRALLAARRALRRGRLGLPGPDLTVELAAATLLRLWARWLRGFADASVPYLLDQFVRRPGRIRRDGDGLLVELDRRPLDIVLELAGYTSPLGGPGFDSRPVTFRLRGL